MTPKIQNEEDYGLLTITNKRDVGQKANGLPLVEQEWIDKAMKLDNGSSWGSVDYFDDEILVPCTKKTADTDQLQVDFFDDDILVPCTKKTADSNTLQVDFFDDDILIPCKKKTADTESFDFFDEEILVPCSKKTADSDALHDICE